MEFKKASTFIFDKLQKELPPLRTYHTVGHVKDVYVAAERIGKAEAISDYEMLLLLTAVMYHDSGFTVQPNDHELISCDIARQTLPGFGYSPEEIELISGMIMATKVPQEPVTLLERIICDADLDYLGRDDFFEIGNTLANEMMEYHVIKDLKEWNAVQIRFLEQHHYWTKTALNTRKAKKEKHLAHLKQRLAA